jgi:hypothetical protein
VPIPHGLPSALTRDVCLARHYLGMLVYHGTVLAPQPDEQPALHHQVRPDMFQAPLRVLEEAQKPLLPFALTPRQHPKHVTVPTPMVTPITARRCESTFLSRPLAMW